MGAADATTMFSNYFTDMVFSYEHGYNYVYPTLESLPQKGLEDPHALRTPGGGANDGTPSPWPQFEADFDEAFDKQYRTTGFSRPLDAKYACNGEDTCNHVNHFFHRHQDKPLLKELRWQLLTGPLEYMRGRPGR
ncbi:hypothetical protein V8C34DRAFT_325036 [Trichoderma compactum]